jgi:hypothetical protein
MEFHYQITKESLVLASVVHGQVTHQGIGAEVSYDHYPSPDYSFGNLTDGLTGKLYLNDHAWVGFQDGDLKLVIDLGKSIYINYVAAHLLQDPQAEIFLPPDITYEFSPDGGGYAPLGTVETDWWEREIYDIRTNLYSLELTIPVQARYLRVRGKNEIPSWYSHNKGKAWIFIDEVIVNSDL